MREIKRDIVSALIFAKDGKLFQGMKDSGKGGVYSDCWHIPGGGVDEGESKEEALKREIAEETGIDVSGYKIVLVDDAGRGESNKILSTGENIICKMKFSVYKVEINDKNSDEIKVSLDDDLVKYRWTDPKELGNLKLTPPSTELFKKLGYLLQYGNMKLYFARHGETNSNLQKGAVSFDDRLTDNGRLQAQQLAARIDGIPIDLIIASPQKRTKETAGIIAKIIGGDVQDVALLEERRWPSEMEGKLLNEPEVEKIFALIREKSNDEPSWHYSDEENFLDIKNRARLFIEYVSGLTEENILAVSHEYFIKMVIATMMLGDGLTYDIFRSFFHFTLLANASLTLCVEENGVWKLATLNCQK